MNAPERVRGFLAGVDVQQQEVARAAEADPATITRRIENVQSFDDVLLGWHIARALYRRKQSKRSQAEQAA